MGEASALVDEINANAFAGDAVVVVVGGGGDIGNAGLMPAMFDAIEEKWGGVDILFKFF
jgi:hypothetical protein